MKIEADQSTIERPKRESRPLTPELGARLFFASFEHSQGAVELQEAIFEALKFHNPGWTMTPELKEQIFRMTQERITNYLKHSVSETKPDQKTFHPTMLLRDDIKISTLEALVPMDEIFNKTNSSPVPSQDLANKLIKIMSERDHKFLSQEKGRPRKNIDPKTPKGDPFLSFICYYGLNGHTTGIPEFDQIYKFVNEKLRNPVFVSRTLLPHIHNWLKSAIEKYNETHPDDQVKDFPLEQLAA